MVYVPVYNNNNCAYVYDASRIRVYSSRPQSNTTITYRDYYFNSHYLYYDGSTSFSNYSTIPTCLANDEVSTNIWYRNDLPDIMIVLFIILFIGYFIIKKIVRGFLYGGRFA